MRASLRLKSVDYIGPGAPTTKAFISTQMPLCFYFDVSHLAQLFPIAQILQSTGHLLQDEEL